MKEYKVTKMDKRHTASHKFKYYITPRGTSVEWNRKLLAAFREWAWTNWGPSTERDWASLEFSPTWAWDTEYNHLRIYLRGDKELSMFHLKWGA